LIDSQKKIHNFCVKQITERIFLKRFIPKAYDSCIEKKTRIKKTGIIYLTVAKNFRADIYFSKKGDNEFSVYFLLFPYPKNFSQFFSSHWKK